MRLGTILILASLLAFSAGQVALVQAAQKAETALKQPPAQPTLIAPYDKKLMRLAEVLGSIHFLRNLCGADEGLLWREKMTALITAEKPRPARKTRLIARFNRGYNAFNRTYRTCTPAAILAIRRYMKEGVRLSSQISSRYGR